HCENRSEYLRPTNRQRIRQSFRQRNLARGVRPLLPDRQPIRKPWRQAGFENFLLRFRDVVIKPAQFDRAFVQVVNNVSSLRIAVARLADAADVDEIFAAGFNLEFRVGSAPDDAVPDKSDRHVSVAEEADAGVLVSETGGGG